MSLSNTAIIYAAYTLTIVSILVIVDVSLKSSSMSFCVSPYEVSILVIVDVSLKLIVFGTSARCIVVSILVIVDVSLKSSGRFTGYCALIGFNPCYSGCLSQISYYACICNCDTVVSILVIVDVSLK